MAIASIAVGGHDVARQFVPVEPALVERGSALFDRRSSFSFHISKRYFSVNHRPILTTRLAIRSHTFRTIKQAGRLLSKQKTLCEHGDEVLAVAPTRSQLKVGPPCALVLRLSLKGHR
jgi:hypothetical protein